MSRSVRRYDQAAIRLTLETLGRDAALQRWPKFVVDPVARVLGLIDRYRPSNTWDAQFVPLLGTKPDSVLAGELGLPVVTVRVQRTRLGIPPANVMAFRAARRATLQALSDDELAGSAHALRTRYGLQSYEIQAERDRRLVKPRRSRQKNANSYAEMRRVAVLALREAFPDATLEEFGDLLGCTRERVRQILIEASASACASALVHHEVVHPTRDDVTQHEASVRYER